jgi:hypothetical protein
MCKHVRPTIAASAIFAVLVNCSASIQAELEAALGLLRFGRSERCQEEVLYVTPAEADRVPFFVGTPPDIMVHPAVRNQMHEIVERLVVAGRARREQVRYSRGGFTVPCSEGTLLLLISDPDVRGIYVQSEIDEIVAG